MSKTGRGELILQEKKKQLIYVRAVYGVGGGDAMGRVL